MKAFTDAYIPSQMKDKPWKYHHKTRRGTCKSRGARQIQYIRTGIKQRPVSVEARKVFGHWEGDLMSFAKNSQFMLILQERKTRFTLLYPIKELIIPQIN